jgi:hypothetical protein
MNRELEYIFRGYIHASGPGSTIEYTTNLRRHLSTIFDRFNIQTVLDAPCGDMVWMTEVLKKHTTINYIGGDIVDGLVAKHKETFKEVKGRIFLHLDITEDPIPYADLWIIRDVLFHLSPENIKKALLNFKNSEVNYILTTSHGFDSVNYSGMQWNENRSISNGYFDLLNLFASPYNFPEPLYRFDDTGPGHPKREMCLWSKEQLVDYIS